VFRSLSYAPFLLFVSFLFCEPAFAEGKIRQAGKFGIGIGSTTMSTGLSGKYFLEDNLSLQGSVGAWRRYGYSGRGYFHRDSLALGADLLMESFSFMEKADFSIDGAIGGGLGLGFADYADLGIAASFILGVEFNIHAIPLDIVIEYRPHVGLSPIVDFDLIFFSGHLRYYF
jgi:hypothetical protein